MKLQIDQSGKIEQTNRPTVIAATNRKANTVLLSAKAKRSLQKTFRQAGKPRMFVVQTFSAAVYLTIEEFLEKGTVIAVDREYPGHEDLIKNFILQLVQKKKQLRFPAGNVRFGLVGKSSQAHKLAHDAYKEGKANKAITAEEVLGAVLLLDR